MTLESFKQHADAILIVGLVGTGLAFLLRRIFGEQRSEKFLAFEQKNPRAAAVVTLLDGAFFAIGMLGGAVYQLLTGKAPPVLAPASPDNEEAK